jgi:hypothetical protein
MSNENILIEINDNDNKNVVDDNDNNECERENELENILKEINDSSMFDYNFNGVTHECPIFDKPIFDINIIAEVLRK